MSSSSSCRGTPWHFSIKKNKSLSPLLSPACETWQHCKKCWLIIQIKWLAACVQLKWKTDKTEQKMSAGKRTRWLTKCSLWLPACLKWEKKTKSREEQSWWKRQQAKLNKKKTQTNGKQGTFQGSYILLMCPAIKRTSSSRVSWIWFIPIAMWTTISRETD